MAKIVANAEESVYSIKRWLGLNEAPEGGTTLKPGEASVMVNLRVNRDGSMTTRLGTKAFPIYETDTDDGRWMPGAMTVYGTWNGLLAGEERTVVAACATGTTDVYAYELTYNGDGTYNATNIMRWNDNFSGRKQLTRNPGRVSMFPFNEKLYIICGGYFVWDGTMPTYDGGAIGGVENVSGNGYVPIVTIDVPIRNDINTIVSGGTSFEQINLLNTKRRAWVTTDGMGSIIILPDRADIRSVASVINRATGESYAYTVKLAADGGKNVSIILLDVAPPQGDNLLEVSYTVIANNISLGVLGTELRFAEIYNGTQDNRVFLYSDKSNTAIYTGIDNDGKPNAEYFPALNFISFGDSDTPITGMIRHFSRLVVFKRDSAYSVQYGQITLPDGNITSAFYTTPTNRQIGNEAPGMMQLVENNPITLFDKHVYLWRNTSSYSSNLSIDERQAKRISDRVWKTLSEFDFSGTNTFDDNRESELYLNYADRMVIYNYAHDIWYTYKLGYQYNTEFSLTDGQMWRDSAGLKFWAYYNGEVQLMTFCEDTSEKYWYYDTFFRYEGSSYSLGAATKTARWESGALSFNRPWMRKFSSRLFLSMLANSKTDVDVYVTTDRRPERDYDKQITIQHNTLDSSKFGTPQVTRLKLKAKKFAYYCLSMVSEKYFAALGADIKARYTGDVK